MVPARNLLRHHYDSYGGWFGSHQENPSLRSDPMASDGEHHQEEGEAGTSSKDTDDWLRLGIGGGDDRFSGTPADPTSNSNARVGQLIELDLFSDKPPPLPSPLPSASRFGGPWGYWNPNPITANTTAPPPLQYSFRRLVFPPGSSEMRVVSPPRRPQAGVWFLLQAAQNQVREPFLPQIPDGYLRIKDGRMTVRLLIKYLVKKLGLDGEESEVEITCRGQQLLPSSTLQHVRDNIWCLRDAAELLPDSSSATDHVMTLQYGRTCSSLPSDV